jgi:hypothetical protein
VLFVGPHQPYLAYVADVLPSLGEEGVQTCTLRDLVAEGAAAAQSSALDAAEPGTPHNEAREQVREELLTILMDKHDDEDVSADLLRKSLLQNQELLTTLNRAWPLLEAADLVGDLWSVPAYLRRCAPWLSPDDVRQLQRGDAQAWTSSTWSRPTTPKCL